MNLWPDVDTSAGADGARFRSLLVLLEDLGVQVFPSGSGTAGLENWWVLMAVLCLSAEPAEPRSWIYFTCKS